MEDKLTALQWFYNQALAGTIDTKKNVMYLTLPRDVFKKAKEMEKEQIEEAFNEGAWNGVNLGDSLGQDFYQKKYGSI
jgi:hypothetical protein